MKLFVILGLCIAAGTAAAQAPADPPPSPSPSPEPSPSPSPSPTPPPNSGFHETKEAVVPLSAPVDDERPQGFSVGIGFGYTFVMPMTLQSPNTASARFRLASGLTFEPIVRLQQRGVNVDVGTSAKDKTNTIKVGALARYPLKGRGRVDFVLLGGAFVSNETHSPPMSMNQDTTTTDFSLVYGLACEFWISQHWQISLNALNELVNVHKVDEQMGTGTETVTTTSTYGAIYDPTVSALLHLYY